MSAAFLDVYDPDGCGILLRVKTAEGHRDATDADIKMMLAAPALVAALIDCARHPRKSQRDSIVAKALAVAGVQS